MLRGIHQVGHTLLRPQSTAKIIYTVAGRLPLSAQRPVPPAMLISQGRVAKRPPLLPNEVRSSDPGHRDTPFHTTPAKAKASCNKLRMHSGTTPCRVPVRPRPSTTLRARPDAHAFPDLSTLAALTGRDAQLALYEVSRSRQQPYYKTNRINDLHGLNAEFPAGTVIPGSKSRAFEEERQGRFSLETRSCRELTRGWFSLAASLCYSDV